MRSPAALLGIAKHDGDTFICRQSSVPVHLFLDHAGPWGLEHRHLHQNERLRRDPAVQTHSFSIVQSAQCLEPLQANGNLVHTLSFTSSYIVHFSPAIHGPLVLAGFLCCISFHSGLRFPSHTLIHVHPLYTERYLEW